MKYKHSKKNLMDIRDSFKRQYMIAKKLNDKYYMEFFKNQILELNEQIKERK